MTNYWSFAVAALRKGGIKQEEGEQLLASVVDEVIAASGESTDPIPVSVTENERVLFIRSVKGLAAGGMKEGSAILLVAMYATAVQERVENKCENVKKAHN